MAWTIEFAESAAKQLRKLDSGIARPITSYLRERVASALDPRFLGAALKGDELGQFWRYRVSDYRIVVEIHVHAIRILVVRLGHRRDVCR